MKLEKKDVELFYKLYWGLLFYTNKKHYIIADLSSPDFKDKKQEDILKLNKKIFSNLNLIDSFIKENPFNFNSEELEIIKSWKNFIEDQFFIFSDKEKTIFLHSKDGPRAYEVLGLYDEILDIVPFEPYLSNAILLPFKGKIIYSGLLNGYNVAFGGGFKKTLDLDYNKAKSKFGTISSLNQELKDEKNNYEEEMLKFYLKNEKNRGEYEPEIDKLLNKNPNLNKLYYQEIGKINSRKIIKKFYQENLETSWFAILGDEIISSGKTQKEAENNALSILPLDKKDYIYMFKYKKKDRIENKKTNTNKNVNGIENNNEKKDLIDPLENESLKI